MYILQTMKEALVGGSTGWESARVLGIWQSWAWPGGGAGIDGHKSISGSFGEDYQGLQEREAVANSGPWSPGHLPALISWPLLMLCTWCRTRAHGALCPVASL